MSAADRTSEGSWETIGFPNMPEDIGSGSLAIDHEGNETMSDDMKRM